MYYHDPHILPSQSNVGAQVPSYIPQNASLLYLLTWCLEIRSVPKKVCVFVCVQFFSL